MPKVSLSKSFKPHGQGKSGGEFSVAEALCYSVTEETPAVLTGSVGSKILPDSKGDSVSKNTKFRIPSLGFSKVDIVSSKSEQDSSLPKRDITLTKYQINIAESESKISSIADENLPGTDFQFLSEDGSLEQGSLKPGGKTTAAETSVGDTVFTVKIPKFRKPKFGITWSKGKPSESDIGSKAESEISKGRITSDMTDAEIPTKVSDAEVVVDAPMLDVSLPSMTLKSAAANASLSTSDIKMITEGSLEVKSPDTTVERTSSEIAVGNVEIKIEGPEVKTKMSKFQMPKFGIAHSKGKVSEKVSQSKSEVKSPQLKATVEIADIAVEAPNLDMECGTGKETYSSEVKMIKADNKASEADVHLPSADISIPKPDREIKQDGDGEEKEGHFKMPKFKLPSFSWSPKKEASVKLDSVASLEDQKLAVIPIKKTQFVMPKISLSKIKVPKSQTHSAKAEADATIPKTEGKGDDSIQIPDIERSHSERTEEGAQISIKLADVKIPTLGFSKIETGASQTETGVSSAKTDAALPPSEGSFQQVVLKSSSADEDTIQKTSIRFPKGEPSVELRSPETVTEKSSAVDGRNMKLEGPEGKIKMPEFQKPKFGISLTKGKAELPQLKMTNEFADIAVGVPASELTPDMSDPGVGVCKIKTPQVLTADIETPKVDISPQSVYKTVTEGTIESLEEKESKLKEHEIKAEEVPTEEHQGWFKMPKFRIPAFGRASLKEKKGDADTERSMEKAQAGTSSAKVQTEVSVAENTFSLPHAVAEITIGKEGIQKLGDSVKSSDVSLPKMEGDILLSTEGTDSRVNIPKTETYADIVRDGAEGHKMHTSEFTVSSAELSKSYLSASEIVKDDSSTTRFPTGTVTLQEHKVKSQDIDFPKVESSTKLETSGVGLKPPSAEITLDALQEKIDVSLPKEELGIQNQEAVIKKEKIKGEIKIMGKDSEGSKLKRATYAWSTTKGSEDVKSVEKDMSAGVEVQVEDRAETSKIKPYKFEIPKFGLLCSEIQGFEDGTNLPKSEADSASKTETGTAEMQFQKTEGSIGLDHVEASTRTVETMEKSQGGPEVNLKIPKLKIPKFTFKALPTEADVSVSKVVMDPKGSSTDIEVVQLQASSAIPEETPVALEGSIQKAKSKILTLTEPDIKTAQMTTTIESALSDAGRDIHWSYVEGQEVIHGCAITCTDKNTDFFRSAPKTTITTGTEEPIHENKPLKGSTTAKRLVRYASQNTLIMFNYRLFPEWSIN
uniref:Protein AHNAK2 n=1 Tax=Falco tinnunculus TaxID=100819 RepID=A0A8C4TZS3_FALTI